MKFLIIAKREYLKMIKSKSFWLATLLIPLLMIVIIVIQEYAQETFTNKLDDLVTSQQVLVHDGIGIVNKELIASDNIIFVEQLDAGLNLLQNSETDALIDIPEDIATSGVVIVYAKDQGVLSSGLYDALAQNILKVSILKEIDDPLKLAVINNQIKVNTLVLREGEFIANDWTRFIIPLASVILYFIFTSFATANLLLSVSEEKENRMIEIVLSTIQSKTLIWGKIIGLVAAVISQIIILLTLVIGIFLIGTRYIELPISLEGITLDPLQLVISLIYLILGFLFLANIMVACGAAMPSYREASNFSSIFIILSIFPIYFFTLIIAEPTGPIAIATSYFPFTAPMILMLRNALDAISLGEVIFSILVLVGYIYLSGKLAYKLFEYGAMEYSNKISFGNFFKNLFGHKL
jgi:ABC-2 type transport system permease protein